MQPGALRPPLGLRQVTSKDADETVPLINGGLAAKALRGRQSIAPHKVSHGLLVGPTESTATSCGHAQAVAGTAELARVMRQGLHLAPEDMHEES